MPVKCFRVLEFGIAYTAPHGRKAQRSIEPSSTLHCPWIACSGCMLKLTFLHLLCFDWSFLHLCCLCCLLLQPFSMMCFSLLFSFLFWCYNHDKVDIDKYDYFVVVVAGAASVDFYFTWCCISYCFLRETFSFCCCSCCSVCVADVDGLIICLLLVCLNLCCSLCVWSVYFLAKFLA